MAACEKTQQEGLREPDELYSAQEDENKFSPGDLGSQRTYDAQYGDWHIDQVPRPSLVAPLQPLL